MLYILDIFCHWRRKGLFYSQECNVGPSCVNLYYRDSCMTNPCWQGFGFTALSDEISFVPISYSIVLNHICNIKEITWWCTEIKEVTYNSKLMKCGGPDKVLCHMERKDLKRSYGKVAKLRYHQIHLRCWFADECSHMYLFQIYSLFRI